MSDDYAVDLRILQRLTELARNDSDFDLFYRRFIMADRMLHYGPERLQTLPNEPWYRDYWLIVGENRRVTKFDEHEKSFREQTLAMLRQESNPMRRQYFALIMLMFGDFSTAFSLIDQQLWSPKMREDFAAFMSWNAVLGEGIKVGAIDPRLQAIHRRNAEIFNILRTKFASVIQKYASVDWASKKFEQVKDYKIFFCWLQGQNDMPPLIRACFNSIKQNSGGREIVFIDEQSLFKYIDLPQHILDKFRAGKISRTHFSDIIRFNLLDKYGGLWLDSTTLLTEPMDDYKDFWKMTYFTQKYCHEKDDNNKYVKAYRCYVSYARWASFCLGSSIKHHPMFAFMKDFYVEYWREFDMVLDYVLMDYMLDIAYESIPFVHGEQDAVPINNTDINTLVFHLNEPYAQYPFDKILKGNFINKLSWKAPLNMQAEGTVIREILRRYGNQGEKQF